MKEIDTDAFAKALQSTEAWRPMPLTMDDKNPVGARSASALMRALDMFHVESSPRYQPRNGKTYCKSYVWDVTSALNAEIPHWISSSGEPSWMAPGNTETNANMVHDMLLAGRWGWSECTEAQAVARAAAGHPVVASWANPSGPGHIVMVEPYPDARGTLVAQAGKVCGRMMPLKAAFGDRVVRFFWHE